MEATTKALKQVKLFDFYRYDEDDKSTSESVSLEFVKDFLKDRTSSPLLSAKEANCHKQHHSSQFLAFDDDVHYHGYRHQFSISRTRTAQELLEALQRGESVRFIIAEAYFIGGQTFYWHSRWGWRISPLDKPGWIIDGKVFVPAKG